MIDPEDVAQLVQAVMAKLRREAPGVKVFPATVTGVGTAVQGVPVEVHVDGDPSEHTVEVQSLIGEVSTGDRVVVLFSPPREAYIVGQTSGLALAHIPSIRLSHEGGGGA